MMITKEKVNAITTLLNGTILSLKLVIPIHHHPNKPEKINGEFQISYGVLIGIVGDVNGKLVVSGSADLFAEIGQAMFGMPLEGEMLTSFSGELGNMIAGCLSTNIANNGIDINITSPTVMSGKTTISGYQQALKISTSFENMVDLDIYLLLDS
ncbi:chemotaxis protein CheX [Virgibacillus soli]|uniref:Chemotaxis protein CheX n=1 Tax=Paracerasibacillus soli TaxID=480284 RepID=A0ABU5CUX2_9BACI|nr:chemotaxis protein CheX [Virgibacillus soli]MDY0410175.1 chemotaxis protein CheX [Virgibacillus soli]